MPIEEQRNGNFSRLLNANGTLIPIYDPATTAANPNGSGFIRQPFAGNIIPGNRLDPVAQKMLQFFPLPNQAPSNSFTNSNNWIGQVSEKRDMNQYTTKVDHRFSDKNTLSVRYLYYKHFNDNGLAGSLPDPNVRARLDNYLNYNVLVNDTHSFTPTLLNEFRVGVTRQAFPFQAYSFGQDWPQKLGLPASVPGDPLPRIDAGLPGFGAFTVGLRGGTTWQFFEMATRIIGAHTLKAGFDFRVQQANNYQREVPSGQFNFPAALTGNPQSQAGTGAPFATFMLGAVGTATQIRYAGESEAGKSYSLFFQDDWKATRRLTLNLGLRWDYQQPPFERNGGASNFNPSLTNPLTSLPGRMTYARVDYGDTYLQPQYRDFGPRVGFAYDLTGRGSTILRGGYSIFYPQIFYRDFFGATAGFANTSTAFVPPNNNTNLPAFNFKDGYPTAYAEPLGSALGPSFLPSQGVNWDQENEKTTRSQQWTLSIQQQLPGKWLIDAAYSANKAGHVPASIYDFNQLDPQYNSLGLSLQDQVPNPYAGRVTGALGGATINRSQSLRPFPYYTTVNVRLPRLGSSIYHALLVSVEKRLATGFAILGSYTFAKLISDSAIVPSNFGAVEVGSDNGYQNGKYDRRAERSVDPTDVSNRLVISGIYGDAVRQGQEVPVPWRHWRQAAQWLAAERDLDHAGRIAAGDPGSEQLPGEPAKLHRRQREAGQPCAGTMVQHRRVRQPTELHLWQCGPHAAGRPRAGYCEFRRVGNQGHPDPGEAEGAVQGGDVQRLQPHQLRKPGADLHAGTGWAKPERDLRRDYLGARSARHSVRSASGLQNGRAQLPYSSDQR